MTIYDVDKSISNQVNSIITCIHGVVMGVYDHKHIVKKVDNLNNYLLKSIENIEKDLTKINVYAISAHIERSIRSFALRQFRFATLNPKLEKDLSKLEETLIKEMRKYDLIISGDIREILEDSREKYEIIVSD